MLTPKTESEVVDMVREAGGPLAVRGGGTRALGQPVGEVLSTKGIAGITLYEPGALTIVAKAGTRLAEVEAALAAEGQALPFEPPMLGHVLGRAGISTIGGVVAANASGPRRIQAGACRDALIGVRFVDGRGRVLKNGGRVMKNVTGYDLVKLLCGSHGTLGVLTEVSFKVLPAPTAQATLVLKGLELPEAVAAMTAGLGSPYEVTGAAHLPQVRETWLRLEGFEAAVSARIAKLSDQLSGFGQVEVVRDHDWSAVRDVRCFETASGDLWRLSVKPSDALDVASKLPQAQMLFDWGGGLIWVEVSPGFDLRATLSGLKGHATLVRASAETQARLGQFHPEPAPVAALAAGLRREFDPRGILNPGLMEPV